MDMYLEDSQPRSRQTCVRFALFQAKTEQRAPTTQLGEDLDSDRGVHYVSSFLPGFPSITLHNHYNHYNTVKSLLSVFLDLLFVFRVAVRYSSFVVRVIIRVISHTHSTYYYNKKLIRDRDIWHGDCRRTEVAQKSQFWTILCRTRMKILLSFYFIG